MKTNKSTKGDIKDSKKDQVKLQAETVIIDMPEVADIPGQENVKVPRIREMEDVTIFSADEEGEGILDDLNTKRHKPAAIDSSDVTRQEKRLLKKSAGHQPSDETVDVNEMALDETDDDGEQLNEKSIRQDRSGNDLDTPGADLDDDDENIGEEDEQNNLYSQSQKDN